MGWFKDWKNTRHIKIGDDVSPEEFNMLYRVVKRSNSIRRALSVLWRVLIDVCAIVAAVFSVLAYLKQSV